MICKYASRLSREHQSLKGILISSLVYSPSLLLYLEWLLRAAAPMTIRIVLPFRKCAILSTACAMKSAITNQKYACSTRNSRISMRSLKMCATS